MRDNDGRKLDHKTLETLRVRAVQQIENGARVEDVAATLGVGSLDGVRLGGQVSGGRPPCVGGASGAGSAAEAVRSPARPGSKARSPPPPSSTSCQRLLHDADRPVFLVVDGHPTHRSRAVKEFVASTNGRLRLFLLPGYSPELNPDEWVWKNIKADRVGRAGVTGADDLKAKAVSALHRLQKLPHLIRGFFADPNLRYITA